MLIAVIGSKRPLGCQMQRVLNTVQFSGWHCIAKFLRAAGIASACMTSRITKNESAANDAEAWVHTFKLEVVLMPVRNFPNVQK